MAKPRYVSLDAQAFLSDEDVQLMSGPARGLYALLLVQQAVIGTLPADPERLRRLTGYDQPDWEEIWHEVQFLFEDIPDEPGRMGHPKMRGAWEHALERTLRDRERASKASAAASQARRERALRLKAWNQACEAKNGSQEANHLQGDLQGHQRGHLGPHLGPQQGGENGVADPPPPDKEVLATEPDIAAQEDNHLQGSAKMRARQGKARQGKTPPNPPRGEVPARRQGPPAPVAWSGEVVQVMTVWEDYLGEPLTTAAWERNAKHAELLMRSGGLTDPKAAGAPVCGPQSLERVLGAIRWLSQQPAVSGTGDAFSWRPQVRTIETLRRKWLKVEEFAARAMARSGVTRAAATDQSIARILTENDNA
jgi:hypothetical protein